MTSSIYCKSSSGALVRSDETVWTGTAGFELNLALIIDEIARETFQANKSQAGAFLPNVWRRRSSGSSAWVCSGESELKQEELQKNESKLLISGELARFFQAEL